MSNWSDTPPTVAGTYWVKGRTSGEEWPMRLHEDGAFEGHPPEVQFGPRIPTADELAQIDRERTALCEVATLCMNTRAIMPEFREINDYTEAVDILGAFLERLGELPGLIDGLKSILLSASAPLCLDAVKDDLREATAKINAILGVPNDS